MIAGASSQPGQARPTEKRRERMQMLKGPAHSSEWMDASDGVCQFVRVFVPCKLLIK